MRILVDSSVWIDFFAGTETRQTLKLEHYIQSREDICICGFILTEVLQGFSHPSDYDSVRNSFDSLIYLEDDRSTFELSATIYRELRRHGLTIRKTMDCLIAAIVVQNGVNFLQSDKDFAHIDKHYPLNLL